MDLKYEAYPNISNGEGGISNFLIIYSPLEIEVKLAAYYYEIINQKKFLCINIQALKEKDINILCGILGKLDVNLLIFNLYALKTKTQDTSNQKEEKSIEVQEKFLKRLFEYSKHNNVFIHNNTGNIEYYDYYVDLATKDNILNSYDISYVYLRFPEYNELIDFLEKKELIVKDDEKSIKIQENMKYIGYVGLNEILKANLHGLDWYKTGINLSNSNHEQVIVYLEHLPNQELILSSSWGDVDFGKKYIERKHEEYDYDRLKNVNVNNIKKIINSDLTVIEKIGVLGRYILLAGEDENTYRSLSIDEQLNRIRMICELIYVLYDIDMIPEVIFEKNDNWWGLCCNGGKLIKFDIRHATNPTNIEYLLNTIFHECRHSFQHYAMDHTFNKKWEVFGYTRGFIDQLRQNNAKYMTTDKGYPDEAYRYQLMEADANACGFDCRNAGMRCYNLIDFE